MTLFSQTQNGNMKSVFTYAILFAIGYFLLSTAGELFLKEKVGFNYNLPELWFLLLLPLFKRAYFINALSLLKSRLFIFIIMFLLILVLQPIYNGANLYDIFRTARPIYYIVLIAFYFAAFNKNLSIIALCWLCIGAMAGDLHASWIKKYDFLFLNSSDEFLHGMNISAIFVATSCAILSRRIVLILLVYATAFPLVFFSAFRINLASLTIATLLSYAFLAFKQKDLNSRLKLLFGFSAPVVMAISLSNFLFEESSFASYRLFDRSVSFFVDGISASEDDIRVTDAFNYLKGIDLAHFFPHGFTTVAKNLVSFHYDYPFTFFIDTFGLIVTFFLAVLLAVTILCSIFYLLSNATIGVEAVSSLYILFFPILLLTNGRVFYVVSESIFFGFLIGIVMFVFNKTLPRIGYFLCLRMDPKSTLHNKLSTFGPPR